MPGIAGIIVLDGDRCLKDGVAVMIKTMQHEKSYVSGLAEHAVLGIAAGAVSHKGTFAEPMPFWNEARDVCVLLSGEICDHRASLQSFDSGAISLLRAYEQRGEDFVKDFSGPFSGLVIDLRRARILLFNDRFGLGRVYFHQHDGAFYFASEAKALLKILPHLRQLDAQGLGEFFSCGCVLQNRTFFKGIQLLPSASLWTFTPKCQPRRQSYFHPAEWEAQEELAPDDYYSTLRDTFAQVLPQYFTGRQRVALSLTGGLDSRLIAAWAPRSPYKLECFTFGGLYRTCADVRIARDVAHHCQQRHQVISLNRKFFSEFPSLAKRTVYMTDGSLDISGAVELFVNRLAREIAPVRLTGNYGDEILRGHTALKTRAMSNSVFAKEFLPFMRLSEETYVEEAKGHRKSFILFKQLPWHHYGRFALEQTQVTPRSPYTDPRLAELTYRAPTELSQSVWLALRLIGDGHEALSHIPTDRGHVGRLRTPLGRMHETWQRFTARAEYASDYGMPDWLMKWERRFPLLKPTSVFLGRHKFYHYRLWYQNELSSYVKDVLLDSRTLSRSYLDPKYVERIVRTHLGGTENHTLVIHKLLTTEIIQRQLIEKQ